MIESNSIKLLMGDSKSFALSPTGKKTLNISELVGNLAYHAMMLEAHLTPKAGLVDCVSVGAHSDMDINTFIASSDSLRCYMKSFVNEGCIHYQLKPKQLLPYLRKIGIEAEYAMFSATGGINTHKGMIFTLGLICGAVGWLYKNATPVDAKHVRKVIVGMCASLVNDELLHKNTTDNSSAGERIFSHYGITGIRGEAANGYPTIFDYSLPYYQRCIRNGESEEHALSLTLLVLMANNTDTNLINRGGIAGLKLVQREASNVINTSFKHQLEYENRILEMDELFIAKNLSPGGSADLLAATWLLSQLDSCRSLSN